MSRNGRKARSPAFQAYPADFLASPKTAAMTTEEIGCYWLLLCYGWLDGSLPDDEAFLARLTRMSRARFAKAWKLVGQCFERREDGRLVNPRQERERAFQVEYRERMRDRSERANAARWDPTRIQDGSLAIPPNTQVPIPKSRVPRPKAQALVQAPDVAPASPSPAAVRPAVNGHAPGVHQEFAAWWCTTFEAVVGRPYGFDGGKDGAHVRAILGFTHGALEPARERALILLHASPAWIAEGGKDLGTLRSQWNKLASQGTGQATGSKLVAIREATVPPSSGLLDMPTARRT